MAKKKSKADDKAEQWMDEQLQLVRAAAESQARIAAAQEAHNNQHPTDRINSLAYSIQSFAGRDVETSDIQLRAESFLLFLTST